MKKEYINLDLVSNNLSSYKPFNLDPRAYIADGIRSFLGSFWYLDNKKLEKNEIYKYATINFESKNEETNEEVYTVNFNPEIFSKEISYINGDKEYPEKKFDYAEFEKFIMINVRDNFPYYDHFMSLEEYLNANSLEHQNIQNYYKIKSFYNFYSPQYEGVLSRNQTFEKTLPGFYDFLNLKSVSEDTRRISYENLSFDGLIAKDIFLELLLQNNVNNIVERYFDTFGRVYATPEGLQKIGILVNIGGISKNLFITKELQQRSSKIIGKFIPFPLYNYIEFSNNMLDNEIVKLLNKYNCYEELILYYYSNMINSRATDSLEVYENNKTYYSGKTFDSLNFKNWVVEQASKKTGASDDPSSTFSDKIKFYSLIDDLINNFKISNKKRSYKDIIERKEAPHYPLFFKVTKHAISDKTAPLQTYLFSFNDSSALKFFDTQVKYDTNYYYKIILCTLVLGNEYKYTNFYSNSNVNLLNDIETGQYRIKVKNETSLQIIDIEIANFDSIIIEPPSCQPMIEMLSFNQQNNKIKISAMQKEDTQREEYEILEQKDFNIKKSLELYQQSYDGKIYFKNNKKTNKRLQIYKMLERPKNYSDFDGFLSKEIPLESTIDYKDIVIPNVTYFYTFRIVNEHGVSSNPSPVYKVVLKDEDGIVYLEKEEIPLEKVILESPFKPAKRYIQIIPSINQTIIGNDIEELQKYIKKNNDIQELQLGVGENLVWNKKFKLRLRSKQSGKVLDFNFKFKYNK